MHCIASLSSGQSTLHCNALQCIISLSLSIIKHSFASLSSINQSALHCNSLHYLHWITLHFKSQCTALTLLHINPEINPHCIALFLCLAYYCTFTFLHNLTTALPVIRSSKQSTVISPRCHIIVTTAPHN